MNRFVVFAGLVVVASAPCQSSQGQSPQDQSPLAQRSRTQSPHPLEPAKLRAAAAAVTITPIADVTWSREGLTRPGTRWGERLSPMAFSRDGEWLAVLGDGYVEVRTGRAGKSESRRALVGPAGGGEFFFISEEQLCRGTADGGYRTTGYRQPRGDELVASPSGRFALRHGSQYVPHAGGAELVDLAMKRSVALPMRDCIVTAIAWSPDESLLALACAIASDTAGDVVVFDTQGELVLRHRPGSEAPVTALAFDLDGKSLLWSGRSLRRVDVHTGRQLAWGEQRLRWLAPIDADLVLGHDGRRLVWLTSRALLLARELDLEVGDDREGITVALSPRRDVLAISLPQGLRLYRVSRP